MTDAAFATIDAAYLTDQVVGRRESVRPSAA
jgi:hypothetical protein